jgi:hypothetical protein
VGIDPREVTPAQLQLEFKCFLIDHKTNKHIPVSTDVSFVGCIITEYLLHFLFVLDLCIG